MSRAFLAGAWSQFCSTCLSVWGHGVEAGAYSETSSFCLPVWFGFSAVPLICPFGQLDFRPMETRKAAQALIDEQVARLVKAERRGCVMVAFVVILAAVAVA